MFNEADSKPYFGNLIPSKQDQFWRNLRKNNVRVHEDYEYVSRIDNDFVFVNVDLLFLCSSSLLIVPLCSTATLTKMCPS